LVLFIYIYIYDELLKLNILCSHMLVIKASVMGSTIFTSVIPRMYAVYFVNDQQISVQLVWHNTTHFLET